jgi:hypothetical protein
MNFFFDFDEEGGRREMRVGGEEGFTLDCILDLGRVLFLI